MKIIEINLDLDGVHADFEKGVLVAAGGLPHEITKKEMWKAIGRSKTFFEDLDLMPDALELFQYVMSTGVPTRVLTGLPSMNDGAEQKKRWVAKMLSETIEVIVLPSKNKWHYSGEGKVLIDDRQDMITPWVQAGGIGILHRSAVETIGQLKALGL
jgi:hypothetical protein